MAVLALFLPVLLLGAVLGLARVEDWTTPRRPTPRQPDVVDLRDSAAPAVVEPVAAEVSAPAA